MHWNFPGFVTSDYGALHSTAGALDGTDQEQPFNSYFGTPLLDAVQSNTYPQSVLNTMVQRILTEMFRFNLFTIQRPATPTANVTTAAHQAVGTTVANAGTVLLRNQDSTLPLSASGGGNIAVIGPAASAPADLRRWGQRLRAAIEHGHAAAGTCRARRAAARTSPTRRACRPIRS